MLKFNLTISFCLDQYNCRCFIVDLRQNFQRKKSFVIAFCSNHFFFPVKSMMNMMLIGGNWRLKGICKSNKATKWLTPPMFAIMEHDPLSAVDADFQLASVNSSYPWLKKMNWKIESKTRKDFDNHQLTSNDREKDTNRWFFFPYRS